MKILIIQAVTKEIEEYSNIFIPHNSRYAIHHGYHYLIFNEESSKFKNHPSWLKIECFKKIKWDEYDYIWVLDADCLINDWSIKLENIISKEENEIIISENGLNSGRDLNAGSFILRKTIIPVLLEKYKEYENTNCKFLKQKFWEQEMFNDWFEKEPNIFSKRDMNEINSYFQSCFSAEEAFQELVLNVKKHLIKETGKHLDINMENFQNSILEICEREKSDLLIKSRLYILSFMKDNIDKIYSENINSVLYNELYKSFFSKKEDINLKIKEFKKKQFVHHMMGMTNKDRIEKSKRIISENQFNR